MSLSAPPPSPLLLRGWGELGKVVGHGEEVGGEGEQQRCSLRSLEGGEELEEAQLDGSSLAICRCHLEREGGVEQHRAGIERDIRGESDETGRGKQDEREETG